MSINEVLEINTTNKDFFYEYLVLKKPVLEMMLYMINKKKIILNPKLLQVFALLLYYNYIYKEYDDNVKWKMVFDYNTKLEIMNIVGINKGHLNTYLSMLRNTHLLTGKEISKPFIFYPEDGYELTFKFIFKDEK
jgi:hypothetical protein